MPTPTRRALLALLLATGLHAQSPLTTLYASTHYLISLDGAVYFDLQVHRELSITQIDVNLLPQLGAVGQIEVHLRPGTWVGHSTATGDWTLAGSGPVIAVGIDQPSPCVLAAPIGLPPGSYGIALRHRGVAPMYTFTLTSRTYQNAELTLTAGGASTLPFGGQQFPGRVWNGAIHYAPGGGPFTIATATPHGQGCQQRATSFYEVFPPGTVDLAGLAFTLRPNGQGGHDVTRGTASPITLPPNATNLNLARGGAAHVGLPFTLPFPGGASDTLLVTAPGRILFTQVGLLGPAPLPDVALMLSSLPGVAPAWMDLAPIGARNVWWWHEPATGAVAVAWWDVPAPGLTGPGNTMLVRVHPGGRIDLEYGAVGNASSGSQCIAGFSPGNGARDPGGRDLSAGAPFATATDDPGLGLRAERRPALGDTVPLRITGVPAGAAATALLVGTGALLPPLSLAGLGAPECSVFVDPALATTLLLPAVPAPWPLPVPALPLLLGVVLETQAAAFAPASNALGLLTSNAVRLAVGPY